MIANDLNNLFKKRSVVIWVDQYHSFFSEYERYIREEQLESFVFKGSFMELRHEIVNYTPHFEKRILIYLPKSISELKLLNEYQWLAEIFDDTIRDLLAKHYNCILQDKNAENCNEKYRVLPPNIFTVFSTTHWLNGSSVPYKK